MQSAQCAALEESPMMGYMLPAGSVQVIYSAGEKWVVPDQFPHILRKSK